MQKVLLLALAALLAGQAHAQTRSTARPAARPVAHSATTKAPVKKAPAPKAVAKPAPAAPAAAAPAPKPAVVETATSQEPPKAKVTTKSTAGNSFHNGSNAMNLGVGFGLGYGYGYLGSNTSQTPAMSLSYMRGVADVGPGTISAGGILGYKSYSWKSGSESATWRNIYVGARGAYHYGFHNPKLDTYAGLGLGLRVVSYSDTYGASSSTESGSQLELSSFVGARYYFSDKIGAFSELGYDMSYLKLGLSARF